MMIMILGDLGCIFSPNVTHWQSDSDGFSNRDEHVYLSYFKQSSRSNLIQHDNLTGLVTTADAALAPTTVSNTSVVLLNLELSRLCIVQREYHRNGNKACLGVFTVMFHPCMGLERHEDAVLGKHLIEVIPPLRQTAKNPVLSRVFASAIVRATSRNGQREVPTA